MSTSPLSIFLAAGCCLVGSSAASTVQSDLKQVLVTRLTHFHATLKSDIPATDTLEQVQLATAEGSMFIVEKVQSIIGVVESPGESGETVPQIGTRDLAELRTLISIIFKWGHSASNVIDLTNTAEAYVMLSSFTTRLVSLLFPGGLRKPLAETLITSTILNRHLSDVLRPCLTLGWFPKKLASDSIRPLNDVRLLTMRLLAILSPTETIASLGALFTNPPLPAPHVKKTCASLLSQQLQRPEGVRALCAVIFGENPDSEGEIPLEKLEQYSRILSTVPARESPQAYFQRIIPRVIALLSENVPRTYTRAASFAVSRMLSTDSTFSHYEVTSSIIFGTLHRPFLEITAESQNTPNMSLERLSTLLASMDPSPTLISNVLSPIASALYSVLSALDATKTSDPVIKEQTRDSLATWCRTVPRATCLKVLWDIIEGQGGDWKVDMGGSILRVQQLDQPTSLSLLTPQDLLRAEQSGELDVDSNFLNLRPDPAHFVKFVTSMDRADVISELFVRLLESYHASKQRHSEDDDPTRALLYLQLVMQMQQQLSNEDGRTNMLSNPEHILSFVKNVLQSSNTLRQAPPSKPLDPFRLSTPKETLISEDGDSDDDTPEEQIINADDEMTETAINLLLSILEANDKMSPRTMPILNDIFSLLEPIFNHETESMRTLAREARMVMTARLASTSNIQPKNEDEEAMQETYQKALKLLEDPILPVRAHGLLLLRQLVSPRAKRNTKDPHMNTALIPAILSIFLQSIQDDDSYMNLNAVQGLAAMAQTFGKDVLKGLVQVYTQGLDSLATSSLEQKEVDIRLRVGEALGQIIHKYGETLNIYVDTLVPPLFNVVRSSYLPTTLRTSAVSLLAECVNTHALSLAHYSADLANAMIDLVQVESKNSESLKSSMDSQPNSTDARFPPFRRAALHFLALLVRSTTRSVYDSGSDSSTISRAFINRAKTTLTYIAMTDSDPVIKIMASETVEGLEQLEEALREFQL